MLLVAPRRRPRFCSRLAVLLHRSSPRLFDGALVLGVGHQLLSVPGFARLMPGGKNAIGSLIFVRKILIASTGSPLPKSRAAGTCFRNSRWRNQLPRRAGTGQIRSSVRCAPGRIRDAPGLPARTYLRGAVAQRFNSRVRWPRWQDHFLSARPSISAGGARTTPKPTLHGAPLVVIGRRVSRPLTPVPTPRARPAGVQPRTSPT